MAEADGSNSWLSRLEFVLDPDGCTRGETKILPEHRDLGLSRAQQAEDYAAHISAISREYVPLSRAKLPDRVQHALDHALCSCLTQTVALVERQGSCLSTVILGSPVLSKLKITQPILVL